MLLSEHYRLIILSRTSRLAQYSSLAIANATGIWMGRWESRQAQVPFGEGAFTEFGALQADPYGTVRAHLARNQRPHCELEYQKITDERTLDGLLRFLGVEPDVPIREMLGRVSVVRQNTPSLLGRFTNPDAVISAMQEMGHEDWLSGEAL